MDKFQFSDGDAKTILFRVPLAAKIIIPMTVKTIYGQNEKDYAFYDVKDVLTEVEFPKDNHVTLIQDYAFYNCHNLKSVDVSQCTELKTVGSYAFSECSSIESFTLPKISITTLGHRTFEGCSSLKSFNFPPTITTVGTRLFAYCGFSTFTFDTECQIEELNWGFFYFCPNLVEVTIPKSVNKMINCFSENPKLMNIYVDPDSTFFTSNDGVIYTKSKKNMYQFPLGRTGKYKIENGTLYVGMCAFNGARIEEIETPDSLKVICQFGFSSEYIKNITFGVNLTKLEESALAGSNVTEVIFPESVQDIGDTVFYNCKCLKHVYIPCKITNLGGGIFSGCPDDINITTGENSDFQIADDKFVYSKIDGVPKRRASLYFGNATTVTIIKSVLNLGSRLFYKNPTVVEVKFEENSELLSLGRNVFDGSLVTSLTFPPTLKTIDQYGLYNCPHLQTLTLSESLDSIGYYGIAENPELHTVIFKGNTPCVAWESIFRNCRKLKTVDFANGIANISKEMFKNCIELTEINIPASIKSIGPFAFQNTAIKTFSISKDATIEELPSMCFDGCHLLENISLPPTISKLGAFCFANTKITTFTVPNKVEVLSEFCLKGCVNMETFHIENGAQLKRIQYGVFSGCINFAEITCDSPEFSLNNGALYNKEETLLIVVPPKLDVKYFAFPSTLKTVGENALLGCVNIHQILIPTGSVTVIEKYAFENCTNLLMINIPICTTEIQKEAFKGCSSIQCGLMIENETKEFRQMLVEKALLPRLGLVSCSFKCTNGPPSKKKPTLFLFSLIIGC